MSTGLDQKKNSSAADASSEPLIASPIANTPAGDIHGFGSVLSERPEHDHSADTNTVELQGHDSNVGLLPTAVVIDNPGAVDQAPTISHPAVADTFHVTSGAGVAESGVQNSNFEIQKSGLLIADTRNGPGASSDADHAGQALAHQFDLLIAGSSAPDPTDMFSAATPHAIVNAGGMIGGLDLGGLDLGETTHAANRISTGIDPFVFGARTPVGDVATLDAGQTYRESFLAVLDLASEIHMQDVPANVTNSTGRIATNQLAQIASDSSAGDSTSTPNLSPGSRNAGAIPLDDTTKVDGNTVVEGGGGGESKPGSIISSGAAFWTVGVDHLDGSSVSTVAVYTAGTNMSVGSLAASHLDELHSLAAMLGSH